MPGNHVFWRLVEIHDCVTDTPDAVLKQLRRASQLPRERADG